MKSVLLILIFLLTVNSFATSSGIKLFDIKYENRNIHCAVWYPATEQEKIFKAGIFEVKAVKDAKLYGPVKGIVVLSHGFGGNMFSQHDTAEYLAKNGYAVITPTFPGVEGLKMPDPLMHPVFLRPAVSLLALEKVKRMKLFSPKSFERVFAAGFSVGGYTAAVNAGGKVRLERLKSYCKETGTTSLLCREANYKKLISKKNSDANIALSSIKAAFLMAPAMGALFDKNSFKDVKIPVIVYKAEFDTIVDGPYDSDYVASLIPNCSVQTVKGADHIVFLAPCNAKMKKLYTKLCEDDEGVDRVKVHEEMNIKMLKLFDSAK